MLRRQVLIRKAADRSVAGQGIVYDQVDIVKDEIFEKLVKPNENDDET